MYYRVRDTSSIERKRGPKGPGSFPLCSQNDEDARREVQEIYGSGAADLNGLEIYRCDHGLAEDGADMESVSLPEPIELPLGVEAPLTLDQEVEALKMREVDAIPDEEGAIASLPAESVEADDFKGGHEL